MKKFTKFLSLLLLAAFCISLFASCADSEKTDDETEEVYNAETIVLNVFNWGEYISDGFEDSLDTVAAFEEYYLEKFGKKVKIVDGSYDNIKITTPDDLELAEKILKKRGN